MNYIEKDLEDYICNNLDDFIQVLEETICVDDKEDRNEINIEFVGRQVKIGSGVSDLVFKCEEILFEFDSNKEEPIEKRKTFFIIVELKRDVLSCTHYAQLSKYLSYLGNFHKCIGCIVGTDLDEDLQNIQIASRNNVYKLEDSEGSNNYNYISFIKIAHSFLFEELKYSLKDGYIQKNLLDERLKMVEECQENE